LLYSRADRPFSLIHCDLWGKYHTASLGGCHYFLCIVDDFNRAVWVFLLKDKFEPIIGWWNFVPWFKISFTAVFLECAVIMDPNLPMVLCATSSGIKVFCFKPHVWMPCNKIFELSVTIDYLMSQEPCDSKATYQ